MTPPTTYSNAHYLLAKRSVDDRALNRVVFESLRRELSGQRQESLRILELGAGVGSMVHRLTQWGVATSGTYTCVDADAESLRVAREHLLEQYGSSASCESEDGSARIHIRSPGLDLQVVLIEADVFAFLAQLGAAGYDLVIANAVLDLIDVPALLPKLWSVLGPGGLFWFSINFDGETILLPELALDDSVMRLYHASMDLRARNGGAGDSKTGRHLLQYLPQSGATILEAGSSDWVVWPRDGRYPEDEAYFLHHIVHTIDAELGSHRELDAAVFRAWVQTRHAQVERGELVYIAHQLDVVGRAP